jgi:hypothetical protein
VVVVGAIVVVVVVVGSITGISIKLVQDNPNDKTLIVVVKSGTNAEAYPAIKVALLMFVSKAEVNPSISEYKLKGPAEVPAVVNVMYTVILYWFKVEELWL